MDNFERELIRLLEARGVTRDADDQWVRKHQHNSSDPPVTDDQLRLLNESGPKNTINSRLKLQWVENFSQVVTVLVAEGVMAPWPYQSVFCVLPASVRESSG